jgi:hypothetical protein
MENYWDKMIGIIMDKGKQLRDKKVQELIRKIIMVPKPIRTCMLREYIQRCKNLYAIAYL